MSFPFFIARRIYRDEIGEKRASRPAIFIATIGIAIGLAVMIIAVSIITGFKSEIRDRLAGFDAHLRIFSLRAESAYESIPIMTDDSLMAMIEGYEGVKHVQRYSIKPGMVKTNDAFQGIILKGIGSEYDVSFLNRHLLEGEIPRFSDSIFDYLHCSIQERISCIGIPNDEACPKSLRANSFLCSRRYICPLTR